MYFFGLYTISFGFEHAISFYEEIHVLNIGPLKSNGLVGVLECYEIQVEGYPKHQCNVGLFLTSIDNKNYI